MIHLSKIQRFFSLSPQKIAFLSVVFLVAGLTHFISIYILPSFTSLDAYHREIRFAPLGKMIPLDQPLPFQDPAATLVFCRYDLQQGPLSLKASLSPDILFFLSLRTPEGKVFYSMSDHSLLQGTLDILVLTPQQREEIENKEADQDDIPHELRLTALDPEGFVLIRALSPRPKEKERLQAELTKIRCENSSL